MRYKKMNLKQFNTIKKAFNFEKSLKKKYLFELERYRKKKMNTAQ